MSPGKSLEVGVCSLLSWFRNSFLLFSRYLGAIMSLGRAVRSVTLPRNQQWIAGFQVESCADGEDFSVEAALSRRRLRGDVLFRLRKLDAALRATFSGNYRTSEDILNGLWMTLSGPLCG